MDPKGCVDPKVRYVLGGIRSRHGRGLMGANAYPRARKCTFPKAFERVCSPLAGGAFSLREGIGVFFASATSVGPVFGRIGSTCTAVLGRVGAVPASGMKPDCDEMLACHCAHQRLDCGTHWWTSCYWMSVAKRCRKRPETELSNCRQVSPPVSFHRQICCCRHCRGGSWLAYRTPHLTEHVHCR